MQTITLIMRFRATPESVSRRLGAMGIRSARCIPVPFGYDEGAWALAIDYNEKLQGRFWFSRKCATVGWILGVIGAPMGSVVDVAIEKKE